MGKITFITTSIDEEYEIMPAIELVIESEMDLEAWVLPEICSPEHLKKRITGSSADVYVVSSNRAEKLAFIVAAYTSSPVIGLPIDGNKDEIHMIFKFKDAKKSRPTAIVGKNDTKAAAELAINLAKIPKKPPKKGLFSFLAKRQT